MFSPLMSVCLSVCLSTGRHAGDNPLLRDVPDGPCDDGHCHEGLHRGWTCHMCLSAAVDLRLCFSRRELKVLLSSFAGWSDQL